MRLFSFASQNPNQQTQTREPHLSKRKGPTRGRKSRPAQALPISPTPETPHPQTPYEREQSTKRRGEISELAFALAAARRGFGIARPYGDSERYDIIVAEGDLVTVVWTFRGTNTAAGYGLPPTGARIELRGITVWRIVDGKIREEWTSFDELQAARQFVTQLKWPLFGLLVAAVILLWILCRVVLKLRRTRLPKATSQAT